MGLKKFAENISCRNQTLTKLDSMTKQEMQDILTKMQIDHQKIVMQEGKAQKAERDELRSIRKQIENQQTKVNKHMQLVYKSKAKKAKPKPPIIKNALAAFLVGGIICTLGQIVLNTFTINGFTDNEAGMMTSIFLIVISALLTGLGVYDEIGKFAGAGSMVPITGFANSIVSSALEFKREGYVYGIGAKVFTIAGPVLLYGTLVSALIGLIYYIIL